MSDEMSSKFEPFLSGFCLCSHINEAKPNVCQDGVKNRVIGPAPAKSDLSL